jgi:hypothetical protein
MWLLPYIGQLNIEEMKAKGLILDAGDIYSSDRESLKDAVIIFGGGCTGEIISPDGLIITNHHCGYGSIQSLSTVERNYLKDGFWAMNRAEEIPAPGLYVTFVRKIVDISSEVIPQERMSEAARNRIIADNLAVIERAYRQNYPGMLVFSRPMFAGNEYFLFVYERYNDVRLVGTPPESIGKFGGDTDNWMWPRHTGDFSLFRVYADRDGRPADYSPHNTPLHTPKYLTISTAGYEENDFVMMIGFPGSTSRYMTSYEIDRLVNVDNANRIFLRGIRQKVLAEDMASSDMIRIQYASKYASSSNYWKNSIGMNKAIADLNVRERRAEQEEQLRRWIAADPVREAEYGMALDIIASEASGTLPLTARNIQQYINEGITRSIELFTIARSAASALNLWGEPNTGNLHALTQYAETFYRDFNEPTDRRVAKAMLRVMMDSIKVADLPLFFATGIINRFGGEIDRFVDDLYDNSVFASQERFDAAMANPDLAALANDPAVVIARGLQEDGINRFVSPARSSAMSVDEAERLYIKALMDWQSERKFYPDANFTIRLTYGSMLPYSNDGHSFPLYTTLAEVLAKEDLSNPIEFTVDERLKELYARRDFGPYAVNGDVPVNFISNNDITGGNSGSPVLNAKGELLGLAFDGNWEAMSGDVLFEPNVQRAISVDIRYVLFIIDKFAGAGYLLDEMTIK